MSEAWPQIAGRLTAEGHVLPVRVYYEDTDAIGVVYHANYLKYCERGRTDWLRLLGIHQSSLSDMSFVVRRMRCEFIKPARLDDLVEVETRLVEAGGARVDMLQRISRQGVVLFAAEVTAVLIDAQGRPRRVPRDLAERFRRLP
jgi:acyl-CoA thioester hydrolase